MAEAPILVNPPDWNSFSLDLFCPRCDYNVRMLTGSRCPECGLDLDWPRIIAAAEKRVDNPLFEYQWRTRPVRSFFVTIWLCLRPWRLWKWLPLADAPRSAGLAMFAFLTCLFYVMISVSYYPVVVVASWIASSRKPRFGPIGPILSITLLSGSEYLVQLTFHILTALLSWFFLQIFQQTISKYHIKKPQLSRLIVFAWVPLLIVKLIVFPLSFLYWLPEPVNVVGDCIALMGFITSLGFGLDTYLKVRRGWGIAICLLVLTFLTCFTAVVVVSMAAGTWDNPVAQPVFRAWPGLRYSFAWLLNL